MSESLLQASTSSDSLYRWNAEAQHWDLQKSGTSTISFQNPAPAEPESSASTAPRFAWHLQASELTAKVSHAYEYCLRDQRFKLLDEIGQAWALQFRDLLQLQQFVSGWERKLFENIHALPYNELNAEKIYGACSLYGVWAPATYMVTHWSFRRQDKAVEVADICSSSAQAQLDNTSTFLGIGASSLVRWDKRVSQGRPVQTTADLQPVVQWAEGRDYGRGTEFTCLASSGHGYVVVGSRDGQLRMYNEATLLRAQTQLPSLGQAITSVDVSFDSAWGAPLRGGKFNWTTELGHPESWVVASCGAYSVVWSFKQVKSAAADVISVGGMRACTDYILAQKPDKVLDSMFMHDDHSLSEQDAPAMVVLQQNPSFMRRHSRKLSTG
ncbi:hypothetical protein WJX73_005682 [Symbiochloris irregularis]|uniref:Vacuolar import/degradation Vid27 C-terminal domain-containing protein n=1 Tax=Symbiochloris irregularis TaxID=706552 RepID=A0AAW1PI19_9CHLO